MKRLTVNIGLLVLLLPVLGIDRNAEAATIDIGLSPPSGGALNTGSNPYTQDHATFLAAPNEEAQPASPATGNEVGSNITFDDVSKVLSFDFAYGSAFGFVDLLSPFSGVHFHAPATVNYPAVNSSAPIIINLASFHTASGSFSGRVTGTVVLTGPQEIDLFDNEIYVNVHSTGNPGGEIRAQLIPVTTGFVPVELSGFSID